MDPALLHKRLDEWIAEVRRVDPNLEWGELMSIRFEAGRSAHDGDGKPLYDVTIRTSRVENPT